MSDRGKVGEGTVLDPNMHQPRAVAGLVERDTKVYLRAEEGPEAGRTFDLSRGGSFLVGRGRADVALADPKVSSRHAEIKIFGPEHYYIVDLASTNGTFLNGARIDRRKLSHDDAIRVGDTVLRVSVLEGTVPVSPDWAS